MDITVPKRPSLHDVGMLQTYVQIVSTQSLTPEMGPDTFLGEQAVAPCRQAGSAPHTSGGHRVKSWPDDTQTSIRCNHKHNTHWVHLKCTQIKQQYKPDWGCTIHTHTQLVTSTLSTSNTIANRQQNKPTPSQTTITNRQQHCHTSNQHKRH